MKNLKSIIQIKMNTKKIEIHKPLKIQKNKEETKNKEPNSGTVLKYNGSKNAKPPANSTNGYCQEILALHLRHLPICEKKLTTGISSYHLKVWSQVIHFDLPLHFFILQKKLSSGKYLKATTFKKLPIAKPIKNRNNQNIYLKRNAKSIANISIDTTVHTANIASIGFNL